MANVDALLILLDRYLAWGRIDGYASAPEAVAAFRIDEGKRATREAREAVDWILGGRFPDGHAVDSLDVVEFIMEVEDRYGRQIGDADAAALPDLLRRVRPLLD